MQCSRATCESAGPCAHLAAQLGQTRCIPCDLTSAGIDGVCTACGDGMQQDKQRINCVACPEGRAGLEGTCSICLPGQEPNLNQSYYDTGVHSTYVRTPSGDVLVVSGQCAHATEHHPTIILVCFV